jgi:hypothetical protein
LPAADQPPAAEVKDITETGRLTSLANLAREEVSATTTARGDKTPSRPSRPAAVATDGSKVESIPPQDSLADSLPDGNVTVGESPAKATGVR